MANFSRPDAYLRQSTTRSQSSSPISSRKPPPPIHTGPDADSSALARSGTVEDILTAYYAESPTKSRHALITPAAGMTTSTRAGAPPARPRGQPLPQRMDSSGSAAFQDGDDLDDGDATESIREILPSLSHHESDVSKARKEAEANRTQAQALKASQRTSRSTRPTQGRSKSSSGSLDLIDRLDISGLYGGGGFIRHEGPYAAATGKQGANAPINAFDPSAFSLAPSASSQPSRKPSKRSPAGRSHKGGLNGLDDPVSRSLLSPYAAAANASASTSSTSSLLGGNGGSSSEVSLGFPSRHTDGKGQQLQEIYGVRDAEAFEDYGRARYEEGDASAATSGAASRESVLPGAPVSREDRMQRAQSIWDIEATLKAGKPVGASAPPPMPTLPADPSEYYIGHEVGPAISLSPVASSKPKRSKSLASRFRRKNSNAPLYEGDSSEEARHAGGSPGGLYDSDGAKSLPATPAEERRNLREWPLGASVPASMGSSTSQPNGLTASESSATIRGRDNGVEQLEIRTQAIKFDESASSPTLERTSAAMTNRSLTDDGSASPTSGSGKKSNGLKRLFSTKRKA